MAKAGFTTKVNPTYDDLPEVRYHLPRPYLAQARAAVGDWVAYYEPRRSSGDVSSRGGRQAYFAVARVTSIEPDPKNPDHFYAYVSDYLERDRLVPFKEGQHYYESALMQPMARRAKAHLAAPFDLSPTESRTHSCSWICRLAACRPCRRSSSVSVCAYGFGRRAGSIRRRTGSACND